ncbi:uncharacterized protein LOC144372754 [Ictidomys tridecemlineatus]
MAAKDAEPSDGPRGLAPRLRSGHAEWLWKGRKQDSRRAPANHQAPPILTGFSFSCKTPGGGAGTLAGAPSLRQRWDIYIFLGWSLPLAEKARLRGNWRAAVPCLAHLRQPRSEPEPEGEGASASSSDRGRRAGPGGRRLETQCQWPRLLLSPPGSPA